MPYSFITGRGTAGAAALLIIERFTLGAPTALKRRLQQVCYAAEAQSARSPAVQERRNVRHVLPKLRN